METPNLSYVNKLSGDDEAFKEKLIKIIKFEFPLEKEVYLNNLKAKKHIVAAADVHKLKHKISILGLEKSYKIAEDYENNLKEDSLELKEEFDKILETISAFLETL